MAQTPDNIQRDEIKLNLKQGTVHKGSVLIVDDDSDIVGALQSYLEACGYVAVGCTSGKEAVEILKKDDFELMLTDLMMPDMDGIELLRSAQEINPHLIGIIITGNGTVQSAVDAIRVRAFDYLLKPFQFALLSPLLARAMKVRELRELEDRCCSLARELSSKVGEFQNIPDKDCLNDTDSTMFYYDSGSA